MATNIVNVRPGKPARSLAWRHAELSRDAGLVGKFPILAPVDPAGRRALESRIKEFFTSPAQDDDVRESSQLPASILETAHVLSIFEGQGYGEERAARSEVADNAITSPWSEDGRVMERTQSDRGHNGSDCNSRILALDLIVFCGWLMAWVGCVGIVYRFTIGESALLYVMLVVTGYIINELGQFGLFKRKQ